MELLYHVYLSVQINFIKMEIFVQDVILVVNNVLEIYQANVLVVQEVFYILMEILNHVYLRVQINFILFLMKIFV